MQGLAHAECLLNKGWSVTIYNIDDDYAKKAREKGFKIENIENGVREKIIYLLVSDEIHSKVYDNHIKQYESKDTCIILAHGYSLMAGELKPSEDIGVIMIAPRMPGRPIVEAQRKGSGVPAFWDIYQGEEERMLNILQKIASDIGFSKSDFTRVNIFEECKVDLFIEQYFLPRLIVLIEQTYEFLVKNGVKSKTALYELFMSGELGMLLEKASQIGLMETWVTNASPTCRFGLNQELLEIEKIVNEQDLMRKTLEKIESGKFKEQLARDVANNMAITKKREKEYCDRILSKAAREIISEK